MGTAIVTLALGLSGCGGDDADTTSIGTTTTSGVPATSSSTLAAEDSAIDAAIAAIGTRYRFTALVTVGGIESTRVEGVVYDGLGQYAVSTAGQVVEYVIGPSGQWARQGTAPWTVLAGPAPVVDPLGSLAQPVATTVVSREGSTTVIDATYPASALGFTAGDDIVVTLLIVDGAIAETRYTAPVGDQQAVVVTTIAISADLTPVTVPSL